MNLYKMSMISIPDIFKILFITFSYFLYHGFCKNYCSPIFCNNSKTHTLCKFKTAVPSDNCFAYEKLIKTNKDKQDVLDKLNSRRNRIASGEIRSLGAAENMLKLIWNDELELFAQRWADQCVKSSLYHDTDSCRDLENVPVGQNVANIYGEAPGLTASSLVDLWYMELLNMNASILHRYKPSSFSSTQHFDYFTQLAWAETSEVGCAGVQFKEINMSSHLEAHRTVYRLVCNFAPSGNRIGESAFISGIPCSRCSLGSDCDSVFKFLCAPLSRTVKSSVDIIDLETIEIFNKTNISQKYMITKDVEQTTIEPNLLNNSMDNDTHFDFLSHLFDVTNKFSDTEITTKCKEVLAVDEFIELLKMRLSNDQILKNLLLSSTNVPTTEVTFTDGTVVAIINKIYSKKESPTTYKTTESNDFNSTVLADLVEAVIFRHSDVFSMVENENIQTTNPSNIDPVKIQAKLVHVSSNVGFTGHYFFPEDEEQTEHETTDFYDDTETIGISEIGLEIEELKRNRATKSFLDEILDSDFTELSTENVMPGESASTTINSVKTSKSQKRSVKLPTNNQRSKKNGILIKYSDLLKRIANDLRKLKFNQRFHCTHNNIEKMFCSKFLVLLMYLLLFI